MAVLHRKIQEHYGICFSALDEESVSSSTIVDVLTIEKCLMVNNRNSVAFKRYLPLAKTLNRCAPRKSCLFFHRTTIQLDTIEICKKNENLYRILTPSIVNKARTMLKEKHFHQFHIIQKILQLIISSILGNVHFSLPCDHSVSVHSERFNQGLKICTKLILSF